MTGSTSHDFWQHVDSFRVLNVSHVLFLLRIKGTRQQDLILVQNCSLGVASSHDKVFPLPDAQRYKESCCCFSLLNKYPENLDKQRGAMTTGEALINWHKSSPGS